MILAQENESSAIVIVVSIVLRAIQFNRSLSFLIQNSHSNRLGIPI